MSNTLENLRVKLSAAAQLESVVRTMKAQAAANIGQYELAMKALSDYDRTLALGLTAFFHQRSLPLQPPPSAPAQITAIVFGSDQGLVGQFNDRLADYVQTQLAVIQGKKTVWAVGERVAGHLVDAGFTVAKTFAVPGAITAITPLVGDLLASYVANHEARGTDSVYSPLLIFHNRPESGTIYTSAHQQLWPLGLEWQRGLCHAPWPTDTLPEVIESADAPILVALIREYLFISLFKSCAESLAAENTSRLAAMQRAEKNIDELLESLQQKLRSLRQSSIDEELFDVLAGYVVSGSS
jgi:F-type H+-transporting ATPase subunit gamma